MTDYFTHISGSRPKYHPADVVEWVELVEAVELFTPAPESRHGVRVGEVSAGPAESLSARITTACQGHSPGDAG
jgi:hypothetical protein